MMYTCKCFKCGKEFESENQLNQDGFGRCPPCEVVWKEMAEKVNKSVEDRKHANQG